MRYNIAIVDDEQEQIEYLTAIVTLVADANGKYSELWNAQAQYYNSQL